MNIRNYIILFFLLGFYNLTSAQTIVEPSPIGWYTIEEADSLFQKNPKPILVDVYTDWCGWCKHMMKTTFAHKGIAAYINTHFYPVKFNAEGYDTLIYNGKTYTNKGVGNKPKHDLANYLLKGKFSFPTIVYIDYKKNIYPIPGFMKVNEIEPVLIYFVEQINNNMNFQDWQTLYQFTYPKNFTEEINKIDKSLHPDTTGHVDWYKFKEATELSVNNKKPILVYFYSDWCHSCKVLEKTVIGNPVISGIINDHFYPVKFNAASQETVTLYGQQFTSTGAKNPHKVTYSLLQKSFQFPAFVFINENKQKMDEVHGFLSINQLESIVSYFSEGNYVKLKYQDFLKTFKSNLKK